MALQTPSLLMAGLGISGDIPPNSEQPKLADGIHLRWSFDQELGFPWRGFYLFRRPHRAGGVLCLSMVTDTIPYGNWSDTTLNTINGQLSSDTNLVVTDQFPQGGVVGGRRVGFELSGRSHLRFDLPENEPAHQVSVRIWFPDDGETKQRCVDFRGRTAKQAARPLGPNPYVERGIQFAVRQPLLTETRIDLVSTESGPVSGLNCGALLEITLPRPSLSVELILSTLGAGSTSGVGATVEAFNDDGSSAGTSQVPAKRNEPETVRLTGKALTRVTVAASINAFEITQVWLHNFCFAFAAGPRDNAQSSAQEGAQVATGNEIRITVLSDEVEVAATTVASQPGQVVSASVEADSISAITISSGAAVLVDICFALVSQDATIGWAPLLGNSQYPAFPYPMSLPVFHPDYPAAGNAPVNLAAAESMALGRVRYGPPGDWAGALFVTLHDTLLDLVVGGPSGAPMAVRSKVVTAAPISPNDDPPRMPNQRPLDLVLLASLHPPLAQMLGLYWLDATADPTLSYDYLIVADYKGVGGRNADQMLLVLAQSGFTQVEGYIVFNKRVAPAPSLPAPRDVRVYALPGGTFPKADGTLPDAQNNAGLRWDLEVSDVEVLQPDKPIMYHVWRADLGDAKKPAQGVTHNLITRNRPVLVTEPRIPPGAAMQRAADWPPFPLHFIDAFLPDGWYSHQVSGIDIFGRHSSNSNAADWYQWKPMPDPRPWYYQDPPGDAVIREDAVRLRDTTPPPPPTGVEAHALDPADPTVVQDHWYETWRGSLKNKKERARLIGLRLKWIWTRAHQQQASDAREFRIYFHPGSALPAPDHSEAINWQERYYVVAYDDPNAFKAEGLDRTRFYEILLPAATDQFRDGLALEPSLAEPVVYAHIGVSVADDETHTVDAPKWTAGRWGDRFGNEGRVGSVTIYRVLRTPPDPPAVPPDSKKVFATPADYYSRSFYTYRWRPVAFLKTQIFRAMDDTVFKTDWSARPRPALTESQLEFFPDETIDPRWSLAKRQQVAVELNQLNSFAHDDAGTAAAMAYYRGLSNDALRILAGLPGNEGAFTQLTINPLDPDDPANANRRGADNDDSFVVDPALRAYVDTLDGRATNRYFYRATYEDGAHNRSQFSLSGPPVYLPKVVPPRAPVITKVVGGDRQITLRWASNREPDLAEYGIYRSGVEQDARDIRLMTLVHTEVLPPSDRESRPAELLWIDAGVISGRPFWYRVVAVDTAGNVSEPSMQIQAQAFRSGSPPPPDWVSAEWNVSGDGVLLEWSLPEPGSQFIIQRRANNSTRWLTISEWLAPNITTFGDSHADSAVENYYRIKSRDSSGNVSVDFIPRLVSRP